MTGLEVVADHSAGRSYLNPIPPWQLAVLAITGEHDRIVTAVAIISQADQATPRLLTELGQQFGEAFNQLDGTRNPFIETEEREELFEALNAIIDDAETEYDRTFDTARQRLLAGVEDVRTW